MKKIKIAIFAISTLIGISSITKVDGSSKVNITFRTIGGGPSGLPVNPTLSQIATFKQVHCYDAVQVCAYAFTDGNATPSADLKGIFL
ncbi:hypothetical protein [Chitinophaga nivalis]|uniref:Uncharacterized protein n=1 Tax=Chitinophaga nivalis TaxID=2991709 RepID=A0ABT3IQG5_9BACT|nr:hypothetical protein [Chitinophaga nivalis]MCW3464114.1 hypothetical protein [Chitinophaga nivalis]MCW3486196.1 hypothetical protein [Chitinophaga nivalis]